LLNLGEAAFVQVTDDSVPFELVSAAAGCSLNTITLTFSRDVDPASVGNLSHYSVTGPSAVTILSAALDLPAASGIPTFPASRRVILTLSAPLTAAGAYGVTVNGLTDNICGEAVPANTAAKLFANQTPRLVRAEADCSTSPAHLVVTYDRPMGANAGNPGNYSIAGVTVSAATLLTAPNDNRVNLTITPGFTASTLYTLTVNNVSSLCGTALPAGKTISFLCNANIKGKKYNDLNGNGSKQAVEPGLPNWVIRLDSPSLAAPLFTVTAGNGNYGFSVAPDNYAISEVQQLGWTQTQPAGGGNYTYGAGSFPINGANFGNQAGTITEDMTMDMVTFFDAPYKSPCCGQNMYLLITYKNIGTTTLIGRRVRVDHSGKAQYISVSSTPALVGPALPFGLTFERWDLPTLLPGASGQVLVKYFLNPGAPQNCSGTPQITALARGRHAQLPSAYASYAQKALCSFDPNDKTVSPEGCGPEGFIHRDLPLTYTVQFQNTGTGPAYRVVVRDTLDSDLDVSTVQVIGNSHPYVLQVNGQQLVWTFDNIGLPESSFDEPGSHGYVKFVVQPLPALAAGTVITNNAAIYFDLNAPITTVTTTNTITENPVPVAAFAGPAGAVPVGTPTNFTYTGGTSGATFLWDFGTDATPATSTAQNPTGVSWSSSGYKLVTLQVNLGGCEAEPAMTLVGVGTPRLDVRRDGNSCVLSWHDANFSLQETDNLVDPASWHDSSATVTVTGGDLEGRAPLGAGPVFYRLILE
jgi:uncharacterized repeat protein (TIGR01451 family)